MSSNDTPIGKGASTLDYLMFVHPWLREHIESLQKQVTSLRQKNRNQKLELRRLNTAHVMKNARVSNLETENVSLTDTIRAFIRGEIEVVRAPGRMTVTDLGQPKEKTSQLPTLDELMGTRPGKSPV